MSTQAASYPVLGMSSAAQDRLHGKLQVLRLLDHYRLAHDYSHQVAQVLFAQAWNTGELAVDEELRTTWPHLSPKTLDKWRLALKRDGVAALAGKYGNRSGQNVIDAQPDLRDHIIGMLVQFPHANTVRIMEFLQARFRSSPSVNLPSDRTLQRWVGGWKQKNAQTFTAVTNPDAWKNQYMVAQGSATESVVRLNQRWEVDCTPADLLLADGQRYVLSCGIDVYTRRMRMLVTKSARTAANMQLLRRMLIDFGVPEAIKSDQGKDYVSRRYELALANIGVLHPLSTKFSPWEKPCIERGQQTFLHDLVELLPGYVGHNVSDAQELRASKSFAQRLFEKNATVELKLTVSQLQEFCDNWCLHRYENKIHGELGKTPFQVFSEWREPIKRIDDVRALDLLLADVPQNNGIRVVQKKGVRLPEGWFIAPELESYIGQQVQVFYLPDAGKAVVYLTDGFKFVCIAELPELTGISREEIAAKTKHMQRERVQQERAVLREISKRISAKDAAQEILRDNMLASGKLVPFPKRAEHHTTDALQAAADAHAALNPAPRDRYELTDRQEFARLRAEQEAKDLVPQPRFESRRDRAWWIAAEAYKRDLTSEELDYLNAYRRDCPREAADMDTLMHQRYGDDAAEM